MRIGVIGGAFSTEDGVRSAARAAGHELVFHDAGAGKRGRRTGDLGRLLRRVDAVLIVERDGAPPARDDVRAMAREHGIFTWVIEACTLHVEDRVAEIVSALAAFPPQIARAR